ncbi:MAG: aldo/keto reductase, partial [Clostridia bacterium]|nr:aldo/keto reductase [Clostridia bacterium]
VENNGLLEAAEEEGKGVICFSPLAQGLLTDRYIAGIPEDSRVKTDGRFLNEGRITPELIEKIIKLNNIAHQRGQTLAQMALGWVLKDDRVTSVLIGASKSEQIIDNLKAAECNNFTDEELRKIDEIIK